MIRSPVKLTCLAIAVLLTCAVAFAGDATGEFSFSASLFNPNDGGTSYSARFEYLTPLAGGPIYAGPSGDIFDGPGVNGGSVGVAGEVHVGKTCGPGFGGAAYKPFGDLADDTDYLYELRGIFECGNKKAAVKVTGRQVWSKTVSGATIDPDGKRFDAGVVWRF